jgi:hypothetical protein
MIALAERGRRVNHAVEQLGLHGQPENRLKETMR